MIIRNVYLTEFQDMPFVERAYYVLHRGYSVNFSKLKKSLFKNPLHWCLLDVIKLMYLPVLFLVLYPMIIIPTILFLAAKLKTKYVGCNKSTFKYKCKMIR